MRRVWKDPNKSIHKSGPFTPTKTVCTGYAKPGVSATSRRVSSLRLRAAFFVCSVDGASFCCVVVDGDHGDAGAGACGSITEPGVIGSVRRECRSLGSRNFSADGRPLVTQINCATSQFSLSLSLSLVTSSFFLLTFGPTCFFLVRFCRLVLGLKCSSKT